MLHDSLDQLHLSLQSSSTEVAVVDAKLRQKVQSKFVMSLAAGYGEGQMNACKVNLLRST